MESETWREMRSTRRGPGTERPEAVDLRNKSLSYDDVKPFWRPSTNMSMLLETAEVPRDLAKAVGGSDFSMNDWVVDLHFAPSVPLFLCLSTCLLTCLPGPGKHRKNHRKHSFWSPPSVQLVESLCLGSKKGKECSFRGSISWKSSDVLVVF